MTIESHGKMKLTIELVPSTVWYLSIYQFYKKARQPQKWHEIKKGLFEKEGRFCWICREESAKLEAHEIWSYDDIRHIQKLEGIHHLCHFCHKIKHIGLWLHTQDGERMLKKEGFLKEDIIRHFCKVNGCSWEEFKRQEDEAFRVWKQRSRFQWKQDFGEYDPAHERKQQENLTLQRFL